MAALNVANSLSLTKNKFGGFPSTETMPEIFTASVIYIELTGAGINISDSRLIEKDALAQNQNVFYISCRRFQIRRSAYAFNSSSPSHPARTFFARTFPSCTPS